MKMLKKLIPYGVISTIVSFMCRIFSKRLLSLSSSLASKKLGPLPIGKLFSVLPYGIGKILKLLGCLFKPLLIATIILILLVLLTNILREKLLKHKLTAEEENSKSEQTDNENTTKEATRDQKSSTDSLKYF